MKHTLLAVIALAIALCANAQREKAHPSFGEIAPDEIKMQSYALDTSANAVVLFDIGQVFLTDDLSATYKRHVRIKFFGSENIDEYANVDLDYERDTESITKIKATTYNMENGKMVESKLTDDGIFKSKVDKYISNVKFTLPNVKPGSIVEYSYTRSMNVSLLPSWKFQHTIPTIYSEYETIIPKTFTFRKDMQGFLFLTDQITKNEGSVEKLIVKDAPAFKVEPFLTTPDDYVSAVHYYIKSIFVPGKVYNFDRSWRGIGNDHEKSPDFGGLIRGGGWLDKTVEPIIAGATTGEEKAKRIHDYLKANITWNEVVDRIPDHSLKKVLEEKKGSSSEINMLMIIMMRRANIDAYPVLISTRSHGLVRQFTPYGSQFNDVICFAKIDGKERFFDATNKSLPYTTLPDRCMNGAGLLVKSDASEFIPIVSAKSRVTYSADFKLQESGELTGKLTIVRDGSFGGQMRSDYASLGKEKYLSESFAGKGWEFGKSDFMNVEGLNEAPKELHEVVIRDHAQANGGIIYLNPYVAGIESNQFKSEVREYPVHIPNPFDKFYTAKIEIPEGYKVEEIPGSKIFMLPEGGGKFAYNVSVLGNTINFTSQLSITKNMIVPTNYAYLREFYSMVVAKQAEQIVLKKIQ